MKKNSRLKSFFAILLAVSMIFQQSSLTVLATDDTYVEDATATPTPSESEAEAYATEEGAEPVVEKQEEPQQMQETPAAEQGSQRKHLPSSQQKRQPSSRQKHLRSSRRKHQRSSQQRRLQQLRQKHLQQSPQRHLQQK